MQPYAQAVSDLRITRLEQGDFEGLTNLQKLWLNRSPITSIEQSGFEGLTNLQELWLDHNPTTSIEQGALWG